MSICIQLEVQDTCRTQFYRLHSYFIVSGAILTLYTVDLLTLHIIDRQGRRSGFRQFKADHRLITIWVWYVLMQCKTALTATDPKIHTLQRFTTVSFCRCHTAVHTQCITQLNRGLRSEEHTSELQSRGHLV